MTILKLAIRNILTRPLSSSLSAILFATSITIIILLGLVRKQLGDKFQANRDQIHMVVGAQGSKMDLILNSVYHTSPPVGNVKIEDIKWILKNPSVSCVPLAMGDHLAIQPEGTTSHEDIEQRRIIGTDSTYVELYNAKVAKGRLWKETLEVTIGAEVHDLGFNIGDTFVGTHGVGGAGGHVHADQKYKIVGILAPTGTVIDQLILCSIETVWSVHEGHDEGPQISNKAKELAPPYDPIAPEELDQKSIDSLKLVFADKMNNIKRFASDMRIPYDSMQYRKKKMERAARLIRSNLRSVTQISNKLSADLAFETGLQDSVLSVRDSFSVAGHYDLEQMNDMINSMEQGMLNNKPYKTYRTAKLLEHSMYNITNGIERVRHDSIVQIMRARRTGMRSDLKDHYLLQHEDKEITSLLITFEGGRALDIQRIASEYYPQLNVALVEVELLKLYDLIKPAIAYVKMLAYIIMIISGISILISLIRTLRERKYEMALMRVMGATRLKIFSLVMFEGIFLSFLGYIVGVILGHGVGEIMARILEQEYHYNFTGFILLENEFIILLGTIGIGFAAALIPAIIAMFANISATLSEK